MLCSVVGRYAVGVLVLSGVLLSRGLSTTMVATTTVCTSVDGYRAPTTSTTYHCGDSKRDRISLSQQLQSVCTHSMYGTLYH
jgi:hypothetical protein